jgi:hypothetical protein
MVAGLGVSDWCMRRSWTALLDATMLTFVEAG